MKIKQSIFTILLMMVSLFAIIIALAWDFKTAVVPVLCGGTVFALCFFQFMRELKGSEAKSAQIMDLGFDKEKTTERESALGAIRYFGWLIGLYISILLIGLYPSIGIFVILYLLASRQVTVVKAVIMAVIIVGVVYVVINEIAQETLPDPWLYQFLF